MNAQATEHDIEWELQEHIEPMPVVPAPVPTSSLPTDKERYLLAELDQHVEHLHAISRGERVTHPFIVDNEIEEVHDPLMRDAAVAFRWVSRNLDKFPKKVQQRYKEDFGTPHAMRKFSERVEEGKEEVWRLWTPEVTERIESRKRKDSS